MAKTEVKVDISGLLALQAKLSQFNNKGREKVIKKILIMHAGNVLAKTVYRTPVGQYPKSTGKQGGSLRRSWKMGQVRKEGDTYYVDISNSMEYASYVNSGHRTRKGGFVEGKFMYEKSVAEAETELIRTAEREIEKELKL